MSEYRALWIYILKVSVPNNNPISLQSFYSVPPGKCSATTYYIKLAHRTSLSTSFEIHYSLSPS
jgi:hypothetical protein